MNINLDIYDKRKIFSIVKIMSHQAQILEKRGISELYILCRHEL